MTQSASDPERCNKMDRDQASKFLSEGRTVCDKPIPRIDTSYWKDTDVILEVIAKKGFTCSMHYFPIGGARGEWVAELLYTGTSDGTDYILQGVGVAKSARTAIMRAGAVTQKRTDKVIAELRRGKKTAAKTKRKARPTKR